MSQRTFVFVFLSICLVWGGSFFGIYYSLQSFPPFEAAFLRIAIGLIAVFAFALLFQKKSLRHPDWWKPFFLGWILIALPWMFLFWGEQFLSPALTSLLNATVPFCTVIHTPWLMAHERIPVRKRLGVAVGFFGIALIFGPQLLRQGLDFSLWGVLAVFGMANCYAVGTLLSRRFATHIPLTTNLLYQSLGASVFLGVVCLIAVRPLWPVSVSSASLAAILYLGIFSTAVAWYFFLAILRDRGSLAASSTTYFVPVIAIILDAVFLHKTLTLPQVLGVGFIFYGLFFVQSRRAPAAV